MKSIKIDIYPTWSWGWGHTTGISLRCYEGGRVGIDIKTNLA